MFQKPRRPWLAANVGLFAYHLNVGSGAYGRQRIPSRGSATEVRKRCEFVTSQPVWLNEPAGVCTVHWHQ